MFVCRTLFLSPTALCGHTFVFLFVFRVPMSSVEVSVFKYQPGVQTPVEQLHNYRISSRGGAITGSLTQTEERRGENVSGSVDIAAGSFVFFVIRSPPGAF